LGLSLEAWWLLPSRQAHKYDWSDLACDARGFRILKKQYRYASEVWLYFMGTLIQLNGILNLEEIG
jgi:hypothetical protein